jgi:hypothetical protein
MNTLSHNVLAPSNAQHSKVMRNVQYLKVTAPGRGRWRKVSWKQFKLRQRTAEYQRRVITNSTNNASNLVIRNGKITTHVINPKSVEELNIKPNCKNNLQLSSENCESSTIYSLENVDHLNNED